MVNVEHLVALAFLGLGGLFLIYLGYVDAGAVLLGAIGGYAFKNGVIKNG